MHHMAPGPNARMRLPSRIGQVRTSLWQLFRHYGLLDSDSRYALDAVHSDAYASLWVKSRCVEDVLNWEGYHIVSYPRVPGF